MAGLRLEIIPVPEYRFDRYLMKGYPMSNKPKDTSPGVEKPVERAKTDEKSKELTERELNAICGGDSSGSGTPTGKRSHQPI